jgi:hypothetical protein
MPRSLRVFPPAGPATTTNVNGKNFQAAPGAFLDVDESVAESLVNASWTYATPLNAGGRTIHGGVGPSSARPTPPVRGQHYLDTQIGADIVYDGQTWRNSLSAAAV